MLQDKSIITGVWHNNKYRIIKQIGKGAIGTVYLVEQLSSSRLLAMKVSESLQSIAAEHSKLTDIHNEVQSKSFGPLLYELDDINVGSTTLHYYTMEYIDGVIFSDAISKCSYQQALNYISELLLHLQKIHNKKLIFSDIKAENILIDKCKKKVRIIDYGGVVQVGRMIKQYSTVYDRAIWQLGSRNADVLYDIFAVGILTLQIFVSLNILQKAQKNQSPKDALYGIIHRKLENQQIKRIILKALAGHYISALDMQRDLKSIIDNKQSFIITKNSFVDRVFWSSLVFLVGTCLYVFK